jgi:hypothetical protein
MLSSCWRERTVLPESRRLGEGGGEGSKGKKEEGGRRREEPLSILLANRSASW